MLGTPGETEKDIRKTITFAKKLNPDYAQFSLTIPYPGTELYQMLLLDQPFKLDDWDAFTYANLGGKTTLVHDPTNLTREKLEKLLNQAYKEFYIRLAHIKQSVGKITSIQDFKIWLKGTKSLLQTLF